MHGPSSHRWIHSAVRITFTIPASESPVSTRKLGHRRSDRRPKHVNTRAKAAMMIALDRHRKYVVQSQRYYEKKRSEGKKHNQAVRALGRHLSRIIYKMLTEERPQKGNNKTKVSPRSSIKTQIIWRPKILSRKNK